MKKIIYLLGYTLLSISLTAQCRIVNELIKGPNPSINDYSIIDTFNGKLFLTVEHGTTGFEPSLYDPVLDTFILLKDLNFGNQGSNIIGSIGNANKFYFKSYNGIGTDLYVVYKNFNIAYKVTSLSNKNYYYLGNTDWTISPNYLYFSGFSDPYGNELYKTEGSSLTTQLILDIYPGTTSSEPNSFYYNSKQNAIYFQALNSRGKYVPMISKGTLSSTKELIKNSILQKNPGIIFSSFNNQMIFSLRSGQSLHQDTTYYKLYRSDGTEKGTIEIDNFNLAYNSGGLRDFVQVDSLIYFWADNKIYFSNGKLFGTKLLYENSDIYKIITLRKVQNKLVFIAEFHNTKVYLGASDLATGGTEVLTSLEYSFLGFEKSDLVEFNNKLYFVASIHGSNDEIWESDGTQAGTKKFFDIDPDINFYSGLTVLNSKLYFIGNDRQHGTELWVYEPIITGTSEEKNAEATFNVYYSNLDKSAVIQSASEIHHVEMYDLNGQKFYSQRILPSNHFTIALESIVSGIYIIQITSTNGTMQTKKFVVPD